MRKFKCCVICAIGQSINFDVDVLENSNSVAMPIFCKGLRTKFYKSSCCVIVSQKHSIS